MFRLQRAESSELGAFRQIREALQPGEITDTVLYLCKIKPAGNRLGMSQPLSWGLRRPHMSTGTLSYTPAASLAKLLLCQLSPGAGGTTKPVEYPGCGCQAVPHGRCRKLLLWAPAEELQLLCLCGAALVPGMCPFGECPVRCFTEFDNPLSHRDTVPGLV